MLLFANEALLVIGEKSSPEGDEKKANGQQPSLP